MFQRESPSESTKTLGRWVLLGSGIGHKHMDPMKTATRKPNHVFKASGKLSELVTSLPFAALDQLL